MIAEIVAVFTALVGISFGCSAIIKEGKQPLYFTMIILAMLSGMLAFLFMSVHYFASEGQELPEFNVALLAVIGSELFLVTANYGQMDSLVDDKTSEMLPYRWLAIILPVIELAILVFFYLTHQQELLMIGVTVVCFLAIGAASYYNFKHLIIPDIELGFVRAIRGYNLLACIYSLCWLLFLLFRQDTTGWLGNVATVAVFGLAACLLLIPIVIKKELEAWKI